MHKLMKRVQKGALHYYICEKIPVRHAFTAKAGGVSTGACESLNLGFGRGDREENVRENYRILSAALGIREDRVTMTHQVHRDEVAVVTEETVGMGLHRPMAWEADAIVTNLPDTPLAGFYADCTVTLLCDPVGRCVGACHAGWRGTAAEILKNTVETMASLGARRGSLVAVIGPSIRQCCFETDADVPEAMERSMGARVRPFIEPRGAKWHIDLQGINQDTLLRAGLLPENIIDSGMCTYCMSGEFWSHRVTKGVRGVQAGVISL